MIKKFLQWLLVFRAEYHREGEYLCVLILVLIVEQFTNHDIWAGALVGFGYYIYRYFVIREVLTHEEWGIFVPCAILGAPLTLGLADYFEVGAEELSDTIHNKVRAIALITSLCFVIVSCVWLHNLWNLFLRVMEEIREKRQNMK